jgi:O-antigen ligase
MWRGSVSSRAPPEHAVAMLEGAANTNLVVTNNATSELALVSSTPRDRTARLSFVFLWSFTVAIYARPEDIFPFLAPLHLTFILGLCSGLAYVGALLSGHARLLWSRELRIVFLLTAWYALGVPFSLWRGGSLEVLIQVWLKTLLVFFLLTQTLVTIKRIHTLLWAIILSELVVASFSIIQSSRVTWVGDRMLGVNMGILGWNFLGIAVAITTPYIAAMFVSQRSLLSTSLLAAASLSMLWMLVLTASRGGLLNVLLSAGLTCLLVLRGRSRGRVAGIGIVVTLFTVVSLAPQVFWERLGTVWNSSETYMDSVQASAEESTQDRLAVLERSIEYTLEHPIFGLGLGNFEVASGMQLAQPSAWMGTHNTFTEVSSEAGLPALILLLGLLVIAVLNMKRISRTSVVNPGASDLCLMARATLASLLSFVFGAFFAHLAYEYYLFYPVAIAVGLDYIARSTLETRAPQCRPPLQTVATNPAREELLCQN